MDNVHRVDGVAGSELNLLTSKVSNNYKYRFTDILFFTGDNLQTFASTTIMSSNTKRGGRGRGGRRGGQQRSGGPAGAGANWEFGSLPANNRYRLSNCGTVLSQINAGADRTYRGAIADGAGRAPMTSGVHIWELEMVKTGAHSECAGRGLIWTGARISTTETTRG